MGKFTKEQRAVVKSIVTTYSIKRITDDEIINDIYRQTNKTITTRSLYDLKGEPILDMSLSFEQSMERFLKDLSGRKRDQAVRK